MMQALFGRLLPAAAAVAAGETLFQTVPTVDLTAPVAERGATLRSALQRWGFFYVKNHGVATALVDEQFAAAKAVFALPTEAKRDLTFEPTLDIGWLASQGLDEDSGKLDTKEGFLLSTNGLFRRNVSLDLQDPLRGSRLKWPPVPGYEATMRRWTRELYALNQKLNEALFDAVGLDAAERHRLASRPFVIVKQLRYAPTRDLGAGAHADWGSLTVLVTDDVPGLEILTEDGWLPVPPRPDCFIVNAGDQVDFWTRGFFKSSNHRVRPTSHQVRFSTALFAYFDYDVLVTPLAEIPEVNLSRPLSPGITTGDYFAFKLCESVGKAPEECRPSVQDAPQGGSAEL
ncbi:unnamed protein product [Effrenium voratum]|uniref:Fe2OG dioxygenase domain-containing protein n=1 Tax=Effrenium voratum TaxID=2562239 RepID=A0AA36J9P2_9DINO|nr:unnamed protein product [Effrenium voratum]